MPLLSNLRRRPWTMVLVVLGLAAGLTGWLARGWWSGAPRLERTKVAVAVFSNRTGDSTLEPLGSMAADWVTRGLIHTALVDVVDIGTVYVQGRSPVGAPTDPLVLARQNGAGTVVSGSYYRAADTLVLRASVVDVVSGTVLQTVAPVQVPASAPVGGLEELQQRVMAAIASALDVRYTTFTARPSAPASFAAYQAFVAGQNAYWLGRPATEAGSLFAWAASQDTTFLTAAVWLAFVGANGAGCPLADSVNAALMPKRGALTPFDRLTLDLSVAKCHNDWNEAYRLAVAQAELRPRSTYAVYTAGFFAVTSGRPGPARALLRSINPEHDLGWLSDSAKTIYWRDLIGAEHFLGEYEDELEHAQRLVRDFPTRLPPRLLAAQAMAGLGRSADALKELDVAVGLPEDQAFRVFGGITPGTVCYFVAAELAVHGDSAAARRAAELAVGWYREGSGERLAGRYDRLYLARALALLGRLDEAVAVTAFGPASDSSDFLYLGLRGVLAGRRGLTEAARAFEDRLARIATPGTESVMENQRARIALALGERDRALELLNSAFRRGLPRSPIGNDLHSDPFFDPLRGDSRFEGINRGE